MKKTVIALYCVVVAVLAAATIVEKYQGTDYVSDNIYGAWWFSALWALLAATAVFYFIKRRVRRASTVALHLSFVIILAGALLTHLTARRGVVHLRQGQECNYYLTPDEQEHALPFTVCLKRFQVQYHEGTEAPADYVSHITINGREEAVVSMNHIVSHSGIRLYQSSYDEDLQGSILAMNSDPWGIPVTYCGYALLFVALIWMLLDPHGTYRQLLRRTAILLLLCSVSSHTMAANGTAANGTAANGTARVLPKETADRFGRLFVVYNDRVCPMETYALDFTKKLCGKRSYNGYTATQVLTGFVFFYDDWTADPITTMGKHPDQSRILIQSLHSGLPLKIFPYTDRGTTTWYAPTSTLPDSMNTEHQKYIRDVFTLLNGEIQGGRYDVANQYLDKMLRYQQTFGHRSLPGTARVQAEHVYNRVPFATILFMVCLTLGMVSFLLMLGGRRLPLQRLLVVLCWLALTLCLMLRWTITGHVPLSNGYETMLFLAWAVMLLAFVASRRFPIMLTFGFLLSGFFLLVSHISQMDPQMSHLMPVLNSPLLTLHVSIIMMAYALLALTFVASLTALLVRRQADQLQLLSQLMLYPALTCLGLGIFIGAIWANVSWGTYWSWDPKETWALITFMVYAAPAHRTLRSAASTTAYHLYMTLAFLTILMTYFGVNYFLGGMHSYA